MTVLATRPLTNVAAALRENPVARKIASLYMMGGAFHSGHLGSTTDGFDNTQEVNLGSTRTRPICVPHDAAGRVRIVPLTLRTT